MKPRKRDQQLLDRVGGSISNPFNKHSIGYFSKYQSLEDDNAEDQMIADPEVVIHALPPDETVSGVIEKKHTTNRFKLFALAHKHKQSDDDDKLGVHDELDDKSFTVQAEPYYFSS